MNQTNQQLLDKNQKEIERILGEIKECELEIARLKQDLELEKNVFDEKLAKMPDDYIHNGIGIKEIKANVSGTIGALESMITAEKNKTYELKTDLEVAKLRKSVLADF